MEIVDKKEIKENCEYVYIADFGTGFLKIGTSKNVRNRVLNISKKYYKPLRDYTVIKGSYSLESFLHNQFKENWVFAEWFKMDYEKTIKTILSIEVRIEEKPKKEKEAKHFNFIDYSRVESQTFFIEGIKNTINLLKGEFPTIENKTLSIQLAETTKYYKDEFGEQSEEYIDWNDFLSEIKTIKDYYFYLNPYLNFSNDDLAWAYISKRITPIELITMLNLEIKEFLEETKDQKGFIVRLGYPRLEELETKIADIIEFNSSLINEKELYTKIKDFVDKQ